MRVMDGNVNVTWRRVGNPVRIAVARLGPALRRRGLIPGWLSTWMSQRWVHRYSYHWGDRP